MPRRHRGHYNTGHYRALSQDLPVMADIDQKRVTDILNGYLAWHHFPLRMYKSGMCVGFSTVYAKYVLEGKKEEFKKILQLISSDIQPNSEHDNIINHFAVEIFLTQFPHDFEKDLTPRNSIQCLEIQGEHLHSSFNFGMNTTDANWAEIIRDLDLKEDEPMLITGPGHCLCLTKEHGKYVLYDPNYKKGAMDFEDETALVRELRNCLIKNNESDKFLGLQINVVRHPALKEPRIPPFSTAIDLYEKYLTPNKMTNVNHAAEINSNLSYAAVFADEATMKRLIALGATDVDDALRQAIIYKNVGALRILLSNMTAHNPVLISELIHLALNLGSEEAVDVLSTYKSEYKACLSDENIRFSIVTAAIGGNHKVIEKLLSDAKQFSYEQKTFDQRTTDIEKQINDVIARNIFKREPIDHDPVISAIRGGDTDCVRTLITFADATSSAFSEEDKTRYLLIAIKENQAAIVNYLSTQVSSDAIQSLILLTGAVESTELSILRQLKQRGMRFSDAAEAVIAKKEHQVVDFGTNMTILIRKFSDYIINLIRRGDGFYMDTAKFQLFKENCIHTESDPGLIDATPQKKSF